jgi:Domain of unknown function (DUF4391)
MNEIQILKSLQLPSATHVLRTFPYNKIEPRLTTAQKRIISENVVSRGIRILAVISPNNTNIPKYEDEIVRFEEIHFYWIQLSNIKKAVAVYKVFAQIMPYPLVILFTDMEKSYWVLSTHQKQKQTHLLTVDQIYELDETIPIDNVLENLKFTEMENLDLKTIYYSWIKQLLQIELKYRYGIHREISLENNILQKLKDLDRQINQLVKQAKQEKQINKRIALQLEANKLKAAKQALIEKE